MKIRSDHVIRSMLTEKSALNNPNCPRNRLSVESLTDWFPSFFAGGCSSCELQDEGRVLLTADISQSQPLFKDKNKNKKKDTTLTLELLPQPA